MSHQITLTKNQLKPTASSWEIPFFRSNIPSRDLSPTYPSEYHRQPFCRYLIIMVVSTRDKYKLIDPAINLFFSKYLKLWKTLVDRKFHEFQKTNNYDMINKCFESIFQKTKTKIDPILYVLTLLLCPAILVNSFAFCM